MDTGPFLISSSRRQPAWKIKSQSRGGAFADPPRAFSVWKRPKTRDISAMTASRLTIDGVSPPESLRGQPIPAHLEVLPASARPGNQRGSRGQPKYPYCRNPNSHLDGTESRCFA